MLTNKVPFQGGSPTATMIKQLKEAPTPPSQLNPAITPALEQVILTSLEKNPDQRYPTPMAMAGAYRQALMGQPGPGGYMQQQQQPWMQTYGGANTTANFQPNDQTVANYTAGGGYPQQQGGYTPQQAHAGGYPPQQGGYTPQQAHAGGYPPQNDGYAPQRSQNQRSGGSKVLPLAVGALAIVVVITLFLLVIRPNMPGSNSSSNQNTPVAQNTSPAVTPTPTNSCTQQVNIQDTTGILKDKNSVCTAAKGLPYNVAIYTSDRASEDTSQDATSLSGSADGKPTLILSIQVNTANNNVITNFSYASTGATGITSAQYANLQNTFLSTIQQNNYTDYSAATTAALQTLQGSADATQQNMPSLGIPVNTQQPGPGGKHPKH
jgi:hypothetical protein